MFRDLLFYFVWILFQLLYQPGAMCNISALSKSILKQLLKAKLALMDGVEIELTQTFSEKKRRMMVSFKRCSVYDELMR